MIASFEDGQIVLTDSYQYKDFIKSKLFDPKWKKERKAWIVPCTKDNITRLEKVGCVVGKEIIDYGNKQYEHIMEATKEKMASESVEIEPMPIKVKPYQHQIKGYNIACKLMNLFKKE